MYRSSGLVNGDSNVDGLKEYMHNGAGTRRSMALDAETFNQTLPMNTVDLDDRSLKNIRNLSTL